MCLCVPVCMCSRRKVAQMGMCMTPYDMHALWYVPNSAFPQMLQCIRQVSCHFTSARSYSACSSKRVIKWRCQSSRIQQKSVDFFSLSAGCAILHSNSFTHLLSPTDASHWQCCWPPFIVQMCMKCIFELGASFHISAPPDQFYSCCFFFSVEVQRCHSCKPEEVWAAVPMYEVQLQAGRQTASWPAVWQITHSIVGQ